MKYMRLIAVIIFILMMSTTALLVTGCAKESATTTQPIKDITVQEASSLIQENSNNPDFIIVDVRTPAEFYDGHIANAINLDFNSDAFKVEISKLDRAKKYLVYCRTGSRSRGAVNLMKELQFQEIYHMYEGITGWTNGGYPTNQILTSNGTAPYWASGITPSSVTTSNLTAPTGRSSTLVVAASDASAAEIAQADFVVSGTAQDEINAALLIGNTKLTSGHFSVPAGSTIDIPTGKWLQGEGKNTVITVSGAKNNESIITSTNTTYIRISDLSIDNANNGGVSSMAINGVNVDYSQFDHLWIDGQDTTWRLISLDTDSDMNEIYENNLWDSALRHISIQGNLNSIHNNTITGTLSGGEGITLEIGDYNSVTDNVLNHTGDALIAGNGSNYNIFDDNQVYYSTVNAFCLYAPTTGNKVTNNFVFGWGSPTTGQDAVYAASTASGNSDNHTITGNTFIQVPGWGAVGDSYGIRASTSSPYRSNNSLIADNYIANVKGDAIRGMSDPGFQLQNLIINSNRIVDSGNDGINIDNGLTGGSISNNVITGSGTYDIFIYNGLNTVIEGNVTTSIYIQVLASTPVSVPLVKDNKGTVTFASTDTGVLSNTTIMRTADIYKRVKIVSPEFDLSDNFTGVDDIGVYTAFSTEYLARYSITYSEFTSADAGVAINIGRYSSTLTDLTVPDGTITASTNLAGQEPSMAIDASTSTYWRASNNWSGTEWLEYDFGAGNAIIINRYYWLAPYDDYLARPGTWTLQGSNNDADWTTLDSVAGYSGDSYTGAFVNTTAYRYYKLNVTDHQDAAYPLRVCDWQLGGTDSDYFDTSTSEVSKARGYSKIFNPEDLTSTTIASGDTITVGTAGLKTGSGKFFVTLDIMTP